MPSHAQWLHRLPGIIQALNGITAPVLDRSSIESLFALRRRQAQKLMRTWGGFQSGRTSLIERTALLRKLKRLANGADVQAEVQRRRRLTDELSAVRIRVVDVKASAAELPSGIQLEPGRLTIGFESVEELLERLFLLSQAAARDFDGFCARLKTD